MDLTVVSVGVLFGGFVGLLVLYGGQVLAPRRLARGRVQAAAPSAGSLAPALRDVSGRVPLVDRLPLSTVARARIDSDLDRAGVPLRVGEYLALRLAASVGGSALGIFITSALSLPTAIGFVGTLVLLMVAWTLPGRWVESRRKQRVQQVEAQLPDALTLVAKSLRAGAGLIQAVGFAAEETRAPLGPELARALRELRLGADTEGVFVQLAGRFDSQDLDIAVTAMVIQRSVGGNLAEILTTVVRTIRERERVRQEVRVLTSRQRLTSRMMAAMPVLIAAAFIWLNPSAGLLLFDTGAGRIALAVGIGFELLGLAIISRLSAIDF